eukprot:TRINITY_DN26948_c0_g1_i1.p1 TRINITY_DN26948_c0_g1~~TRINITY_DN26948_c0_g1_i1.p1  ORF type:complete len:643 (+),score=140.87 TRINITY_DN26948_c0_g1_i1:95-1930(+)
MDVQVSPLTLPIASATNGTPSKANGIVKSPFSKAGSNGKTEGVKVARGVVKVKNCEFNNNVKAATSRSVVVDGAEEFNVDSVIGEMASLQEVVISPCADTLLKGGDGCVVAIGQSGAGKTHTLFNTDNSDPGVVPLLCKEIIKRKKTKRHCLAVMSMVEIHEDKIVDLLNKSSVCPPETTFKVKNPDLEEHVGGRNVSCDIDQDTGYLDIEGAVEKNVDDVNVCNELLRNGLKRRVGCITPWNTKSSGAHVIFRLVVSHYQGTRRVDSILDVVDTYIGDNSFKTMVHTLAQGTEPGGLPLRQSLLTRMLTRHFRDGNENSCTVLSVVGSKKNYIPETIETLRLMQTCLTIKNPFIKPKEVKKEEPQKVETVSNGGIRPSYIDTGKTAELERALRVCQGKLEATQALVIRLETELHTRGKTLRAERQEKVMVQQDLQDLNVRMQLVEERHEEHIAKLKEAGETIAKKETEVQKATLEAYTADQAVTQLRGSFEEATKHKRTVEDAHEVFKKRVFEIADNKRALDALLELRALCDKQPETKAVSRSHSHSSRRSRSKSSKSSHAHPSPTPNSYGTPPAKVRPLSARSGPIGSRFTRSATGPSLSSVTPRKLSK